jgi:lysyl-tRNA synthetase class 1
MAHWADKAADQIIRRQTQGHPLFTCASGISPSGPVHVGNLRDIITIWFVAKALQDRNAPIRLIHSWDNFDRFRKVPKNVPESFAEFIGLPLSKVPDPGDKYPSYAARHEAEFESAIANLGIEVTYLRQTELYESGIYSEAIQEAVQKRHDIFDVLQRFKTQEASEGDKAAYFPLTIYCDRCGKDTTKVKDTDGAQTVLSYTCACKHQGDVDFKKAKNIKLPWKVDWAMRWRHEGVVFEPGGKDHATAGGSFEVSSEIAKKVFQYAPPIFQPYEFIGLKGLTGKMSGSSGVLLTPGEALMVYQPELLLWIFAKTAPNRAFDLVLDDGLYRLYDEFDKANQAVPVSREVALSAIPGRAIGPVPFRHLAGFGGIVDGNAAALTIILNRMGIACDEKSFAERLTKADHWLLHYAPEQRVTLLKDRNDDYFQALSQAEQAWVISLYNWLMLSPDLRLEEVTHQVYEIPKAGQVADADLTGVQHRFFQIIYNLLFGRDKGPRLGTFLSAVSRESYIELLHFS